ncbi:family 2 glycosyl transferase, partial [Nocardiopsis nanhaiensis]
MASPTPDPLPMGHGVEIDRAVRLTDEGHVLVGGSPPRALRLSSSGVSTVIRWLSGARPEHHSERVLARELVEAGLAHPRPVPVAPGADVGIAVVGRSTPGELAVTLDLIAAEHPHLEPLVVGATGPAAQVARQRGLRVVSGPPGGSSGGSHSGPQARAVALRSCPAEFVALVEPGTLPDPGWLDAALGHFADPDVSAVVPRVLPARQRCGHLGMAVAALAALSADRGADPAPILPWGHGHYGRGQPGPPNEHLSREPVEPVSALIVRRGTADIDPSLGAGAELELLWRWAEEGWSVRYEPRCRIRTPMPSKFGAYLRTRFDAGAAAGPLASRQGRLAAGPELAPLAAVGLGLALCGRPRSGLV